MPFLTTSPLRRRFSRKSRGELAAEEARRRWEQVRSAAQDRTEDLLDVAGDQLEHAVDVAGPKVRKFRDKAVEASAPVAERLRDQAVDAGQRLREEAAEAGAKATRELTRIALDVRDASRVEADRIIQALHDQAEEARADERKKRSRAVLGFTVLGMVAGALLYREIESRTGEDDPIAAIPEQAGDAVRAAQDGIDEAAERIEDNVASPS